MLTVTLLALNTQQPRPLKLTHVSFISNPTHILERELQSSA